MTVRQVFNLIRLTSNDFNTILTLHAKYCSVYSFESIKEIRDLIKRLHLYNLLFGTEESGSMEKIQIRKVLELELFSQAT